MAAALGGGRPGVRRVEVAQGVHMVCIARLDEVQVNTWRVHRVGWTTARMVGSRWETHRVCTWYTQGGEGSVHRV